VCRWAAILGSFRRAVAALACCGSGSQTAHDPRDHDSVIVHRDKRHNGGASPSSDQFQEYPLYAAVMLRH
jgi:hypothetical protein